MNNRNIEFVPSPPMEFDPGLRVTIAMTLVEKLGPGGNHYAADLTSKETEAYETALAVLVEAMKVDAVCDGGG